jgi:CMP-N,N'-diacetyllegionaminic acid synthase
MMSKNNILFLITARKGSQGLPNKNMKVLGDLPLIQYSFDFANSVASSNDLVCVSTNDENISAHFEAQNAPLHFMRPDHLATKTSTSDSVIQHAIDFFKTQGKEFEYVFLLQPTSPFRLQEDFFAIKEAMNPQVEMVVSVKKCKDSPYFNQFREGKDQKLEPIIETKTFTRRQDIPPTYAYNGAYYYFRVSAFEKRNKIEFSQIKKFEMPSWRSIDIDTYEDWELAVFYLTKYTSING